jgi:hypothetical protein
MRIAYWIVAGVLALLYLYSGGIKIVRTKDQLRPMMGWIDTVPLRLVRTIGVLEVLGSIALVLAPLIRAVSGLALAAAVGFVCLQVGAISLHLRRGEGKLIGFNIALLIVAGVAIWLSSTWL